MSVDFEALRKVMESRTSLPALMPVEDRGKWLLARNLFLPLLDVAEAAQHYLDYGRSGPLQDALDTLAEAVEREKA